MPVTPRRHRLFPLLAALALLLVAVAPVRAHAELDTADPGPDHTVEGSPEELVATFTEPLDPGETSIVVLDPNGEEVASGGEPGEAPEEWRLTLPELAPALYEVRWTASSTVDAHLERGTYTFTVAAAPTPSPTPPPTATPEPSATEEPTPSATASPTPSASPSPSPSPSPSGAAQPPTAPAAESSVLIPIVAALALVAALGAWLFRRRGA